MFGRALTAFWSRLGLAPARRRLSPTQARDARAYCVSQVLALSPILVLASAFDVIAVDLMFWREGAGLFPPLWSGAVFAALAAWAAASERARRAGPLARGQARAVRLIALNMALLSAIWATPLLVLFEGANEAQRVALAASSLGVLASAALALAPVWQASLLFAAPLLLALAYALAATQDPLHHLFIAFLVTFSAKVYYLVRERSSAALENFLAAEDLREQGQVISMLLKEFEDHAHDWLFETDRDGGLTRSGDRLAALLGLPANELTGLRLTSLIDESHPDGQAARQTVAAAARTFQPIRDLLAPMRIRGDLCWWRICARPVCDAQGRFAGYRGVGADVTAARRAEAAVERMARFDGLTGLPNRAELRARLSEALAEGQPAGLLCLDLDRFRNVNDTLGRATGDKLLQQVASRLASELEGHDLAARLSGDEFVVARFGRGDTGALESLARDLIAALGEPYEVDGHRIIISVSLGLAACGEHAGEADRLLRDADLALNRAKLDGKGRFRVFEPGMDAALEARRMLELDLRDALLRSELSIHYQPLVDIKSAVVIGCEALARWMHPVRGPISPAEFIPLAEETGLIGTLGEYVVRAACREAASWGRDLIVAVNLSVAQFRSRDLIDQIRRALDDAGLPAHRLELEITESILIDDRAAAVETLTALRALGVRIALDDFGTGYSSLAYLSSFPFDKIKIDRSFVTDVGSRPDAAAIICAICDIARSLGMSTTAEGVETEEELDWLRRHACDEAQGFLFSAPVPPQRLREMIGVGARAAKGASEGEGTGEGAIVLPFRAA